jgi:16S rRNA (guanine527-N7)-methyltransferase
LLNLTTLDNFYLHHVLHSLSIAATFQFEDGFEVLDLGCGGGFPGIPLAVFFPQVRFHLVDSINKKLNVVNEISAAIGLSNLTTQHTRVEDIKNRKFDIVVSRAVAPLGDLWRWSRPLLRKIKADSENTPNGLICLKGGDLAQEIHTSGCKPFVWEIDQIFNEDYFKEKFVLYQRIK